MSIEPSFASAEASIDDPGVDEFCHIVAGIVRRLIVGHAAKQTGTLAESPTPIAMSARPSDTIPCENR